MAFQDVLRNIGNQQSDALSSIWGKGPLSHESPWAGSGVQFENPFQSLLGPFGQYIAGESPWSGQGAQFESPYSGQGAAYESPYSGGGVALESPWSNKLGQIQGKPPLTLERALAQMDAKKKAADTAAGVTQGDTQSTGPFATGDYKTPADAAAGGSVVEAYIRNAATQRGIDPDIAMKVAMSEGGTDVARRGTFNTGSSWWPFQLHYGGKGYEQFGNTAGMGNAFTQATGFQPGDPAAWRASVDYALDHAQKSGWGAWYGAKAQGITGMKGIGQTPQTPAPAGTNQPFQVNRTSQFNLGLNKETAEAFCGPAAAMALASYYGNNIPVEEAQRLATQVGWNTQRGMAGPASQVNLLHRMGVKAQSEAWNDQRAQQVLQGGKPVIIDTPGHYFVADAYDPSRGYRVGTSGTDLRGGGEWLTPAQMSRLAVAGAPRTMIYG